MDPSSRKMGAGTVFSLLAAVGADSVEATLQQGTGGEKFEERLQSQKAACLCGCCCLLKEEEKGIYLYFNLLCSWLAPF